MSGFSFGIRYLTGYAVATHSASRERAEWPPHPARVFMALAAAHFETGDDAEETDALRWLEMLGEPVVQAADADERLAVTTYVPVNDRPTGSGMLQSVVGLTRSKQPRTFPRVRPHDEMVYLIWPNVELGKHREALQRLCAKVTRIGHSSSLVQMWLADNLPRDTIHHRWEPDDLEAEARFRAFGAGSLDYLERTYGENERREYHRINDQLQSLESEMKRIKGRGSADQKAEIKRHADKLKANLPDRAPGDPLRPVMSLWKGYRREHPKLDESVPGTVWDPYVIVRRLEAMESRHCRLDLVATLQVTTSMHKAVIEKAADPVREFVSGHKSDGSPTDKPHLAYLPLAFVGREHATGHLMGLAIAVPRDLDRQQRRQALAAVGRIEELNVGRLGKWKLESGDEGKYNLRPDAWTGGNRGATQWSTVTPIAFDQHPKAKDRAERERELSQMIVQACRRINLPEPLKVVLSPISRHLGVPAAHEFPRIRRKDGSERRHAHVILIFEKPVRGPIALCAGRYRGYGFCRPAGSGEMVSWAN